MSMIKSMTGYGKAEAKLSNGTLTIEIRTLNSKSAEINLRSFLLPKDKDLEIRQRIAGRLKRGNIDVFLTWEGCAADAAKEINMDIARSYFAQSSELAREMGVDPASPELLCSILRMPDVVETKKSDIVSDEEWPLVSAAFDSCLDAVESFRSTEGASLYADVTSRIANILALYDGVESYESQRAEAVQERIRKAAEELGVKLDKERFEQEMIFYLEKYDINEEKVRLRQHCKYFMDTIDGEEMPGKKLGFIIQEIGREINTTGSKANHAEIQKLVVQMKDELEKMREQSMNIL